MSVGNIHSSFLSSHSISALTLALCGEASSGEPFAIKPLATWQRGLRVLGASLALRGASCTSAAPTPRLPTAASFLSGSFRVKLVCHSVPLLPPLSSVFPKKRKREELESLNLETSPGVFLLHSVPSPHPRPPGEALRLSTTKPRGPCPSAAAGSAVTAGPRSFSLARCSRLLLCVLYVSCSVLSRLSFMFHCAGAEQSVLIRYVSIYLEAKCIYE